MKLGGLAIIVKGEENEEIINAVRSLSNGDYYFNSQYQKEILRWLEAGNEQRISAIRFEHKELEIILKLSRGMTCKEVGESIHLSARTIESYRSDLMRKTGTKNTAELISYIYKQDIIN